jgi:cytoskeletal protein CcmA (bactofilin family)
MNDSQAGGAAAFETPALRAVPPATKNRVEDLFDNAAKDSIQVDALIGDLDLAMLVGEDAVVGGKLTVTKGKSVLIKGVVHGDVDCEGTVVISESGKIFGTVIAGSLWVGGYIGPNPENLDQRVTVEAGLVHLCPKGRIVGDTTYDRLSMASGNRGIKGNLIERVGQD